MNNVKKTLSLLLLGLSFSNALLNASANLNPQDPNQENKSWFSRARSYVSVYMPGFDTVKQAPANIFNSFMDTTPRTKIIVAGSFATLVAAVIAKSYYDSYKVTQELNNANDLNNVNAEEAIVIDVDKISKELESKTWKEIKSLLRVSLRNDQLEFNEGSVIQLFATATAGAKTQQPFIFNKKVNVEDINLKKIFGYTQRLAGDAVITLAKIRNQFFASLSPEQEIMIEIMVSKYENEIK